MDYARTIETIQDLASVGDQEQEIDRFSSDFWSAAATPVCVSGSEQHTFMRNCVDQLAAPFLVGVKYYEYVGKRRVRHDAHGPQSIGTVHQEITEGQF